MQWPRWRKRGPARSVVRPIQARRSLPELVYLKVQPVWICGSCFSADLTQDRDKLCRHPRRVCAAAEYQPPAVSAGHGSHAARAEEADFSRWQSAHTNGILDTLMGRDSTQGLAYFSRLPDQKPSPPTPSPPTPESPTPAPSPISTPPPPPPPHNSSSC